MTLIVPVVGFPLAVMPVFGFPLGTPVAGLPMLWTPVEGFPVVGLPALGLPVVGLLVELSEQVRSELNILFEGTLILMRFYLGGSFSCSSSFTTPSSFISKVLDSIWTCNCWDGLYRTLLSWVAWSNLVSL